ncbi:HTH-type transcriptional regulator/antitoxin HigA [Arthrobacter sp. B3I9]|uniref:ImmA/IrrE family metallo-endopeptidase n=1 Tax=Arthrobacter sp. B3I9 TaxID=3042270 RepID=UPI002792D224|nr:ImmA/IrrE family metallo-endopeptidase [Arthrobacter sp. B3I9]MDQ0851353.1 HTH-type transcriptional regulator/antitoxin HigA [Arthrobacter sp. B3I9]
MTATAYPYAPERILPPGSTLLEVLDERAMTQSDLAIRTGLSAKHINQIVKGTASISPETTILLERATGVPASMWTNLESTYQLDRSRTKEAEKLKLDLDWLKTLPLAELAKRKRIQSASYSIDTLREVCNFFGVADKASWEALWERPTAYRRSKAFSSDPTAVAAWLRIGEVEAMKISCSPFDKAKLLSSLEDLRSLTRLSNPNEWVPRLKSACEDIGIAVVFEPEISGARIVGATRWVQPDKVLIQLSLRHRWSDIFWFTFFHEIGHLLLHSKKDVFINDQGPHSGAESEADAFASQLLIPRRFEDRLSTLQSDDDVTKFASELGIGPDIVVGRLQFEKRWPYTRGAALKRRFTFAKS